jgi:arsenate reductase (glutaredoxin)
LTITIYHNPACGTSRNTLAMIRQSREEPIIIEYLKNPPSRARLAELIKAMGIPVRALLREKRRARLTRNSALPIPNGRMTSSWIS